MKIEFISLRIVLVHQDGRRFFVLVTQDDRHDVI